MLPMVSNLKVDVVPVAASINLEAGEFLAAPSHELARCPPTCCNFENLSE